MTSAKRRQVHRLTAVGAAALCLTGGAGAAQERAALENAHRYDQRAIGALKANYLVKFAPFVTWPEAAREGGVSAFRLCIGGHDPLGPSIDRAARGVRVGERPIVVIRLPVVAKGADCHVLFVSTSRAQTSREMLAAVSGRPVLTVADERVEAPGAMIQFVTLEGRLRFDIRPGAAEAEGLVVSSKLLSLSAPLRSPVR